MIRPHGSETLKPLYVEDATLRGELLREAGVLPKLLLNSQGAANAVMLASAYFTPLSGFMNLADALAVSGEMRATCGLFWPVPILNVASDVSAIRGAKRIALLDPNVEGYPVLAIQDVQSIEEASEEQMRFMAEKIFRTTDLKHPGVNNFLSAGRFLVADPGSQLLVLRRRLPGHLPHRRADPRDDPPERLEEGGRLSDPKPHAPCSRGPRQDCHAARGSRWGDHSHAVG